MAEEPASSKFFSAVYMSEWVFALLRCPSSSCFKGCQRSRVPHCPCTGLISLKLSTMTPTEVVSSGKL